MAALLVSASVAFVTAAGAETLGSRYNGRLVFMRANPSSAGAQVMTVNPDGGDLRSIRSFGIFPTFAGENTIGFWDRAGVSLMDADGSNARVTYPFDDLPMYLTVSPNASHAVWARDPDLRPYVTRIDGTDGRYLSDDPDEWANWFTWSADGSAVVYAVDMQIKLAPIDGSAPQVLYTADGFSPRGAALSHDGSRFVFTQRVVGDDYRTRLFIGNIGSSDVNEIAPADWEFGCPVFSPDGTKLAFVGSRNGQRGIGVMNVDGTNAHFITTDPSDDCPSWEPRSSPLPPSPTTTTTSTTTTTTTLPNAVPKPVITIARVKDALKINVSAARSSDTDGTIASYKWQWGDNTTAATTSNASHTYVKAGDYLVRLTVTDNKGARAMAPLWVRAATRLEPVRTTYNGTPTTVPKGSTNAAPVAIMGIAWANYPMQLQTSGSRSVDPDGRIVSYLWDFGDGTSSVSNPASRIYRWPGTRRVRLTVTDNDGAQSSTEAWVAVN